MILNEIDVLFSHKWQLIQIQLNRPPLCGLVEEVVIMEFVVSGMFRHFNTFRVINSCLLRENPIYRNMTNVDAAA